MSTEANRIVQKLWSYCTVLRDDGLSYGDDLEHLGKQHGLLGLVFRKAQNKIQDPAKLKRLVSDPLEKEQWMILSADIKGEAYEGLLERLNRANPCGAWLLGKLQRDAHYRAPARAPALLLFQL